MQTDLKVCNHCDLVKTSLCIYSLILLINDKKYKPRKVNFLCINKKTLEPPVGNKLCMLKCQITSDRDQGAEMTFKVF